tara:strand:- start:924 stop:1721 length:798 start_codon:yes stop_codon:yes gene_type:complete
VSDDGGVTWSSFTLVSSGTTSDGMNNNFYKDFDEFSADAPPTYNVIEFNSTQYVFFPNSPNAEGRLSGNIQLVESVPPCFTAGTLIQTARGEQPIETLKVGDRVITLDGGSQILRWIGQRRMNVSPASAPIRILAGALGEGVPEREVRVSPLHRVLVRSAKAQLLFGQDEVLVAAKFLVNDTNILRDHSARVVDYVHLMFDDHALVYTEGLLSESLQAGAAGLALLSPEARGELLSIFPELAEQGHEGHISARPPLSAKESALLK